MTDTLAPSMEDARAVVAVLAADPRTERVLLIGSVARGDANPHSDIDLLVIVDDSIDVVDFRSERAARAATDWPVDIIVKRSTDFEHMSTCVSASFEHEVAKESQLVYEAPLPRRGGGGARVGAMAPDNLDLAARQAESAAAQMRKLMSTVREVASAESGMVDDAADDDEIAWTRWVRYTVMLQSAHMAIEQSFRAVAAACEGTSLGGGHDLDNFLDKMGDTPERSALAAAVAPVRGPDGKLRTWRVAEYVADVPDWQADITADNAAAHIDAAIVCARVASNTVRSRARTEQQQSRADRLAKETEHLAGERVDAAFIERGAGAALPHAPLLAEQD